MLDSFKRKKWLKEIYSLIETVFKSYILNIILKSYILHTK